MGQQQPGVDFLLAEAILVKRKEMANIVGDEGAAQLCCSLQYPGVVNTNQVLVLSLN